MEAALLHGEVFNIELYRKELEKQNLDRHIIRKNLENQFRNFSRKHSFLCFCCNTPVTMNLTKDQGRPFYFKHFDGRECAYSENTNTYESHTAKHENQHRKDIALTIFKEILEGQFAFNGVKVERGYMYKKKLNFVPDFIIEFPDLNQVWAIDFYTSLSQGIISGNYARNLAKRMEKYRQEGFKVFSFVDEAWLALDQRSNKGTLLAAEQQVLNKELEDKKWDSFLHRELSETDVLALKAITKSPQLKVDTKSIAYVNVTNRTCRIIRLLETTQTDKNLTFYTLAQPTISLEHALTFVFNSLFNSL